MTTGTHLHIFGHSLGGSLAMVLPLVQGFIPPSFDGPITVVAGARRRCSTRAKRGSMSSASPPLPAVRGSWSSSTPPTLSRAAWDRLCRSRPRPHFQAAAERAAGPDRPTKLLLSVIPEYAHLAQTSVLLLRRFPPPTVGIAVPANERKHVLHLHESLSVNLVADHGCEMYVSDRGGTSAGCGRSPVGIVEKRTIRDARAFLSSLAPEAFLGSFAGRDVAGSTAGPARDLLKSKTTAERASGQVHVATGPKGATSNVV